MVCTLSLKKIRYWQVYKSRMRTVTHNKHEHITAIDTHTNTHTHTHTHTQTHTPRWN